MIEFELNPLLSKMAHRLQSNPRFMAYVLATYQNQKGLNTENLVQELDMLPTFLDRLALCKRPFSSSPHFNHHVSEIANYTQTDESQLKNILRQVESLEKLSHQGDYPAAQEPDSSSRKKNKAKGPGLHFTEKFWIGWSRYKSVTAMLVLIFIFSAVAFFLWNKIDSQNNMINELQSRIESQEERGGDNLPPSQPLEGFILVESRDGMKRWELKAVDAKVYDDQGEILAKGIVIEFYENGVVSSRMWAERGRIDQRSHNLEASSNVVIVSVEDGTRLETQILWWDNSKESIRTDRRVVMTTKENDRIEGTGMEALPNMKIIKVENVHGIIRNVVHVGKELNNG